MIKRAMQLAIEHGMFYRPILDREDIAEITCIECGWPLVYSETIIEQYVEEPYGCAPCAAVKENGGDV